MSISLKSLRTRLSEIHSRLSEVRKDKTRIFKLENDLVKEEKDLQRKINLASQKPTITEHAILRYLERIKGIDLEEIKQEILTEKVSKMIDSLESGTYHVNGYSIKVINKSIVTVYK